MGINISSRLCNTDLPRVRQWAASSRHISAPSTIEHSYHHPSPDGFHGTTGNVVALRHRFPTDATYQVATLEPPHPILRNNITVRNYAENLTHQIQIPNSHKCTERLEEAPHT